MVADKKDEKMKNGLLSDIVELLFPLKRLLKADKIVREKIEKLEKGDITFEYMVGYEKLTLEEADKFLNKTFEARKTLEDKAKTNVLGVTISVSLLIGLSQVFVNNIQNGIFRVLTLLIALYCLISVISGTVISLLILGKQNRTYDVFPIDKSSSEDEQLENIALNTELNMNYNVRRNNFLYASYGLIINFLVSLSVLFLLVIIPAQINNKTTMQKFKQTQTETNKELSTIKEMQRNQNELVNEVEHRLIKNEMLIEKQNTDITNLEKSSKDIIQRLNQLDQEKIK